MFQENISDKMADTKFIYIFVSGMFMLLLALYVVSYFERKKQISNEQ